MAIGTTTLKSPMEIVPDSLSRPGDMCTIYLFRKEQPMLHGSGALILNSPSYHIVVISLSCIRETRMLIGWRLMDITGRMLKAMFGKVFPLFSLPRIMISFHYS